MSRRGRSEKPGPLTKQLGMLQSRFALNVFVPLHTRLGTEGAFGGLA